LIAAVLLCAGFSSARAWIYDPAKPLIYEMRIAFETDKWINMYSTATVLSKSDNAVAFRVVANSTTTAAVYQLVVTTQGNVGIATASPAGLFTVGNGTLTVLSNGNVGIGTAGPLTKLHVAGDVVAKAQVFRAYMTSDLSKTADWERLPFNATVFNTLQGTFDTANSRFTASRAGYYQISVTGHSTTSGSGSERYGIGVIKNGTLTGISGGNYSASDTPLSGLTLIVYLNGTTDYVEIHIFSAITSTLAGGYLDGYGMQWYMSYLGE